jgi:hypothetical protein
MVLAVALRLSHIRCEIRVGKEDGGVVTALGPVFVFFVEDWPRFGVTLAGTKEVRTIPHAYYRQYLAQRMSTAPFA